MPQAPFSHAAEHPEWVALIAELLLMQARSLRGRGDKTSAAVSKASVTAKIGKSFSGILMSCPTESAAIGTSSETGHVIVITHPWIVDGLELFRAVSVGSLVTSCYKQQ